MVFDACRAGDCFFVIYERQSGMCYYWGEVSYLSLVRGMVGLEKYAVMVVWLKCWEIERFLTDISLIVAQKRGEKCGPQNVYFE